MQESLNDESLLSSDIQTEETIFSVVEPEGKFFDPFYHLRPPVIINLFKYNKNYKKLTTEISNLEGISNIDTETLPIFHQVWIGPLEGNLLAATLFLTDLLEQSDQIEANVYYWVDPQLTDFEQLNDYFKTVLAKNRDKPTSNIQFKIISIRKLKKFRYIDSPDNDIYNHYVRKKAYNYLKEIICLMCLYEFGGYFFDTTCTLSTDGDKSKLYRLYWKTEPIFAGTGRNWLFDVFFYYAPPHNKIICLILLMMINTFAIYVHGDNNDHKIITDDTGSRVYYDYEGHEYKLTFAQFMEKPYLIEYVKDRKLNEYLMRLTYMINFCNFCTPADTDDPPEEQYIFTRPLRCFLRSLVMNENPETNRFFDNFKILGTTSRQRLKQEDLKFDIPNEQEEIYKRIYTFENGMYLHKYFGLSTWKNNPEMLYKVY